jgi:flagellar motor switch protein FliG
MGGMDRFKKGLEKYQKINKAPSPGEGEKSSQPEENSQEQVVQVSRAVFPSFAPKGNPQGQKTAPSPESNRASQGAAIPGGPAVQTPKSAQSPGVTPNPPGKKADQNPPGLLKTKQERSLRKVAKFLILLGKDEATKVVRHLGEDEIEALGREIATIPSVHPDEAKKILADFGYITGHLPGNLNGGSEVARDILVSAFGPLKADKYLQKAEKHGGLKPFAFLKELTPPQVHKLLEAESLLVQALVMPYLESSVAAGFLKTLKAADQLVLVKRLSKMEEVNQEILEQVEKRLKEKAGQLEAVHEAEVTGRTALLDILKHVDTQTEDSLLTSLQEVDPELAQDLRENAFTIEKIYFIPDEDFAEYLRKYSERDLAVFLKGKSDQVRQKIEACLPSGRRKLLLEEETIIGKMPRSEVNQFTREVLNDLREKVRQGDIPLLDKPEEYI